MIPEHEYIVIGREVFPAVAQEILQRPRIAHIGVLHRVKLMQTVRIVEIEIPHIGAEHIVLPFTRPAREDQHAHIRRQLRLKQLLDICRGSTVLRLEIRAADVPRDKPRVIAAVNIWKTRPRLCHLFIRTARKNERNEQECEHKAQRTKTLLHTDCISLHFLNVILIIAKKKTSHNRITESDDFLHESDGFRESLIK